MQNYEKICVIGDFVRDFLHLLSQICDVQQFLHDFFPYENKKCYFSLMINTKRHIYTIFAQKLCLCTSRVMIKAL